MTPSGDCVNLVKQFEGCRLVGYADISGVPTIGYGHTGPEVRVGDTIDQRKADEFLKWDHAGGKVVAGLTRRRAAERDLFLSTKDRTP